MQDMPKKKLIPLVDLKSENKRYQKGIDKAIRNVLASGVFILGRNVRAFEQEFASYLGVKYAVGVASGSDALMLSLRALGLGKNDEVILPANCYPTAFAVAAAGVSIKLVDVDPLTSNIDPHKIEKALNKKTRVIIPVHFYGQAVDLGPIKEIAQKHNLLIMEDCAQAHGAIYKGKKVGSIGKIGCFSFYPTKNLGAFGDAGMVVTNDRNIAQKIRQFRMYGEKKRYQSLFLGINSRFDELQAAILRVKLRFLDQDNNLRRRVAKKYLTNLRGLNIGLPEPKDWPSHVYHLFVIRCLQMEKVKTYLANHGVETSTHSRVPLHLIKSFAYLGYRKGDFPEAEKASRESLFLPCYPTLNLNVVKNICNLIKDSLK